MWHIKQPSIKKSPSNYAKHRNVVVAAINAGLVLNDGKEDELHSVMDGDVYSLCMRRCVNEGKEFRSSIHIAGL